MFIKKIGLLALALLISSKISTVTPNEESTAATTHETSLKKTIFSEFCEHLMISLAYRAAAPLASTLRYGMQGLQDYKVLPCGTSLKDKLEIYVAYPMALSLLLRNKYVGRLYDKVFSTLQKKFPSYSNVTPYITIPLAEVIYVLCSFAGACSIISIEYAVTNGLRTLLPYLKSTRY